MRNIILLMAGIFVLGTTITTRADILDRWTTNQITTNFSLDSLVYANGLYIATAEWDDAEEILSSVDGVHWAVQNGDYSYGSWGTAMNYSGGRFIGTGGWGTLTTSTTGTNWLVLPLPGWPTAFGLSAAAYGDGTFVCSGYTNEPGTDGTSVNVGEIIASTDGTNWMQAVLDPAGPISSIAFGPTAGFVAIGNYDGYSYTSYDGNSWTRSSIPGGSQVSYGNGLFIVPLNNGTNLVSNFGAFWSQQKTGLNAMLSGISCVNGLFYARAGSSYLATSSDGTNWFQYPQILPGSGIATDGSRIATSENAIIGVDQFSDDIYAGFVFLSDPLVDVQMTNPPASQVALSGLVGRNYQIQSAKVLTAGSNNWSTNLAIQLTNTPYVWTDDTATNSARFYRGVLLP